MEFLAEHLTHDGRGLFVADFGEDFLEEALGEELLGGGQRNAAGLQVEEFGGVDLSGGGAVRAFDVVGLDLESRQRIRFGFRREE